MTEKMHYDECVTGGETFYQMLPQGDWEKAPNAMLTARIQKLEFDLAEAMNTVENIKQLVAKYSP